MSSGDTCNASNSNTMRKTPGTAEIPAISASSINSCWCDCGNDIFHRIVSPSSFANFWICRAKLSIKFANNAFFPCVFSYESPPKWRKRNIRKNNITNSNKFVEEWKNCNIFSYFLFFYIFLFLFFFFILISERNFSL